MSKISPCLWFAKEAEEAANFYVSLGLPDSRIEHVQRNVVDTPAGKEGTVLVVSFRLAGQSFIALNGNGEGKGFNNSISLSIDCEDQAEVDRLWDRLAKEGRPIACSWIADRYGVSWQVVPRILPKLLADPDKEKAARVMAAMMKMVKIDVAALEAAAQAKAA